MAQKKYSQFEQMLHRFALGNQAIAEMCFSMDKSFAGKQAETLKDEKHVFICGLARSGTTVILRTIHELGRYRSLTYDDMPFALMPNLWMKLKGNKRKTSEAHERAHEDGIMVSHDSPEALDEVFWRVFYQKAYIHPDHLAAMNETKAMASHYRSYVHAILNAQQAPKKNLYLSKNNNNIVRLPIIRKAFPHAVIIIPFRDPIQHANSLKRQHALFSDSSKQDKFVATYMKLLAHHEFGPNHRPFMFNEIEKYPYATDDINYWLSMWINVYTFLQEQDHLNLKWLSYEKLCNSTESVWANLSSAMQWESENNITTDTFSLSKHDITEDIDQSLLSKANELYQQITNLSL